MKRRLQTANLILKKALSSWDSAFCYIFIGETINSY